MQDMVKRFEALIRENGSLDYPSSSVSRRHYQIWANAGVAEKQVQKAIKKIKDSGQLSATPADITKMLETMRAKAVRPSGQRSDGLVL